MSEKSDSNDLDAFFSFLAENQTALPVTESHQGTIATRVNEVLHTPEFLHFNSEQNALYPGGNTAFEGKFRPILEAAKAQFAERFSLIPQDLNVVWEGEAPSFRAAARNFQRSDFSCMRTGKEELKVTDLREDRTEYEEFRIGSDTNSASQILSIAHHEFGHMGFGSHLPSDLPIQELPSCFVQEILGKNNDEITSRYDIAHNFKKPIILKGEEGWGVPTFGRLDNAPSIPFYTAWLHAWKEIFGSDEVLGKVLQRSKELHEQLPQTRLTDNRLYRRLPTRDEWLQMNREFVPDIERRFHANTTLGKPIPDGYRTIWTPHAQWGGRLDSMYFVTNKKFFSPSAYEVDTQAGALSIVPGQFGMEVPSLGIKMVLHHTGGIVLDPKTIYDSVQYYAEGTRKNMTLSPSTTILIAYGEGKTSHIELKWNDIAESMLNLHSRVE